jgi:hypothetical protein
MKLKFFKEVPCVAVNTDNDCTLTKRGPWSRNNVETQLGALEHGS